eukprot:CAMPEP_0194516528 /NCGR_PEP_ID=MMETSP0253-20130528/49430_1 /TAXON_ID=2966 /ORGANISM="Noctiluca scintillans" /LENGTH=274 /DNA_ID=CAMNT_0039360389 /DNA_START=228 /DNA_END=1053 /DNA_ORIENTATION=-
MAVQIKEMLPSPRSKGKFASPKMKETDTSPKPRSAAGSPAPSDMLTAEHLEKKAASQDARAYLESHRVLQFVQELLEQLVRDKPEDPYGCMSERLSKKMQCTSSGTERIGRRPRLSKDEPDEDIDKHLLALIANQNATLAEDNDRLRSEINQISLLEAADIQNMEVRKTSAIATLAGQNAKLDTDNLRLRLDIETLRQRDEVCVVTLVCGTTSRTVAEERLSACPAAMFFPTERRLCVIQTLEEDGRKLIALRKVDFDDGHQPSEFVSGSSSVP